LKKQIIPIAVTAFLVIGIFAPLVFADGALTFPRFEAFGRIDVVAGGVGLNGVSSGTIDINVPLTSQIVVAYLYWGGHDTGASAGDDEVTLNGAPITANKTYSDWWYSNEYTYIYVAEVTSLVSVGDTSYLIEDFGPLAKNYGAGIIVVYSDETLPYSKVIILEGLDSFWFDFLNPQGPNSEVTYLDFAKANNDRDMDITLLVGGTENDNRPNEIWTKTGTGAKDASIIESPSAAVGPYPLVAADGNAWDTYTDTVQIPKGDEWVGVQIESIVTESDSGSPNYYGRGDSAVLIAAGFVFPVEGGGKVTGGGQISLGEGKRDVGSFGFNAMWYSRDEGPKGELEYLDHITGDNIHAHILDWLIVWEPKEGNKPGIDSKAIFTGPCTVNHESGYRFEVYVEDNCEPGTDDVFKITIWDDTNTIIYSEGGLDPIIHGNIQIHKPPK
jgi:hypothetical protein